MFEPIIRVIKSSISALYKLDISAVTSTPKDVTKAVDQTLTCNIGQLDASGTSATVTWKDPAGTEVAASDDYELTPGTVDESGNQAAVLTIKQVKMATLSASFTYKCSVKSAQYPDSEPSADKDVVANVLSLG